MTNPARAVLEEALRIRKLDRTLTDALPALQPDAARMDPSALVATDIAALDACLRPSTMAQGAPSGVEGRGGLPRGQLSEIAGPRSSGRLTAVVQMLAAATQRGEIAALVDTCDRFDVASAVAAGVDLDRLLWIRGDAVGATHALPLHDRLVERALKALNLVLQAGGFGVVAIDLADVPVAALNQIPFTTWLRVQRIIEGSDTACVLLAPYPMARSAGGLTLTLTGATRWTGTAARSRRVDGLDIDVRVVSPRRRVQGEIRVCCGLRG